MIVACQDCCSTARRRDSRLAKDNRYLAHSCGLRLNVPVLIWRIAAFDSCSASVDLWKAENRTLKTHHPPTQYRYSSLRIKSCLPDTTGLALNRLLSSNLLCDKISNSGFAASTNVPENRVTM